MQNEEKFNLLEMSNKRINEGLSHLVNHLQDNFITKQEISLLFEKERERKGSPVKVKSKEVEKVKGKAEEYAVDIGMEVGKLRS